MGANEKVDAAMHGVDDTTALIHEGRFLGGSEWKKWWSTGRAQRTLTALAAALEAAQAETATAFADRDEWRRKFTDCHPIHLDGVIKAHGLAAVLDKVKAWRSAHSGRTWDALDAILASAPGDVLREHDAEKWDEGLDAGRDRWMDFREFGEPPVNPYRIEGGN